MGHLRDGKWNNDAVATSDDDGNFDREKSQFLETISSDHKTFKVEADRYHLYVSYACPWAHRTLITRKLKNLENIISVSVVHPDMLKHSWTFHKDFEGATGDHLYQKNYLYEIYQLHDESVTTKVTVPLLWDKFTQKVVNNESSEIIRILNSSFNEFADTSIDLYPVELRDEIDSVNKLTYEPINNGVYKTGFAKTQKSYDKAFGELFDALDAMEERLEGREFLVGDKLSEADIRLVTTLLRFDVVYFTHFKCNLRRIIDFKNLSRYTKDLYNKFDAVKSTTNFDHIKRHYYYSHDFINPQRIIPKGPVNFL